MSLTRKRTVQSHLRIAPKLNRALRRKKRIVWDSGSPAGMIAQAFPCQVQDWLSARVRNPAESLSQDSSGAKQARQQFVLGGRKWVRDRDPLPREALLQVLRKKKTASCFRGRRENHRVPYTELMIGCQIRCGEHHFCGSLDQGIGVLPTENRTTRFCWRSSCLSH